jgi:hypothetical protein
LESSIFISRRNICLDPCWGRKGSSNSLPPAKGNQLIANLPPPKGNQLPTCSLPSGEVTGYHYRRGTIRSQPQRTFDAQRPCRHQRNGHLVGRAAQLAKSRWCSARVGSSRSGERGVFFFPTADLLELQVENAEARMTQRRATETREYPCIPVPLLKHKKKKTDICRNFPAYTSATYTLALSS